MTPQPAASDAAAGVRAAAAADAAQDADSACDQLGTSAQAAGAASAAAPDTDAGGSDYEAPEVAGVAAQDLEGLLADFARRLELGEVDAGTLRALQELGVLRIDKGRRAAPQRPPLLDSFDLEGVAARIKAGKAKHIIVMCGAGVSVSAGIPDFRSPGTGLYSQLERFNLPTPEAIFEMGYFRRNPKPFHLLAKELFPGNYAPTTTHLFLKLLHDKGLLLRVYTQNIDSLEHEAGLPRGKVVAAHGNFDAAHCIACGLEHDMEHVKKAVFADEVCRCSKCSGLVKPDIVFFGENLPERFYDMAERDFPAADLLIVLGTSLVVHPFASLIDCVGDEVPRVLINRERVGEGGTYRVMPGMGGGDGFDFDARHRDALHLGDCDVSVMRLAELVGWGGELEELAAAARAARPLAAAAAAAASSLAVEAGARLADGIKGSAGSTGAAPLENGRVLPAGTPGAGDGDGPDRGAAGDTT